MWRKIVTLILYCLPCMVALLINLYNYHLRTQDVAEIIHDIAHHIEVPYSYIITQKSLDSLQSKVPEDVFKKLESIKDQDLGVEEQFLIHLKETLDNEYEENYYVIRQHVEKVIPEKSLEQSEEFKEYFEKEGNLTELIGYFNLQKKLGNLKDTIANIDRQIFGIWKRNSIIIIVMVFFPFLLLGSRLAFDKRVELTPQKRMVAARSRWPMKFLVACVMAIGWVYVVNPTGRGATTFEEYIIGESIVKANTLPIYIATSNISHTIAGFLGWYLYLLLYFFRKLYHIDVVSTRVYRFLFGKLLFTYGIALTFSAVLGDEAKMALFLIGFFPLSAVSIIKEYGQKAMKGVGEGKANLSDLPGISLWQNMRLEEEGVDSVSTLAGYDIEKLQEVLPKVMKPLVVFWVDVAQLYTVLGEERYKNIKTICQTASGFIKRAKDPEFQARLKESGVENTEETARLLGRIFPQLLDRKKTT